MQNFDIIKNNNILKKSYRIAQIYDQFDLKEDSFCENFKGEIDIPQNWNIGIIVGKSGTGKTTIAKELFGDYFCNFKYNENSVIDDFDKNIKANELFSVLSSVGFSSPPSWLKPYEVLSNGEKMRVDLANAILQNKEIIIFDEYTSVVDREIAKICSLALQKNIKKLNKKFIAVTCHYDIIEWLQPDWIFSTDNMQMTRGCLRQRPKINIEVRQIKGYWQYFRRYHYLNHDLSKASKQYVGFIEGKPVVFCAVINFPHPIIQPMKKIHRIVVLPDYQGIGIALKMLKIIGDIYSNKNEYLGITTSLNNFAKALMNNKNWKLIRYGKVGKHNLNNSLNNLSSNNRNTYSFKFIKDKGNINAI